ncbi:MAG: hypothetical protein S4CHLAM123_14650 [Chlamydiales bacterium]|nr:hypothetical protein [Chlamydiales bacterium]
MPLYRISEMFGRNGLKISRKLLSQWVTRIGLELEPLYNEMRRKIMSGDTLFIDESPLKMQEKKKAKQVYMWVLASERGYRLYDFRENRCHDHAFEILKGYQGVVHSDKYGAYETLAQQKKSFGPLAGLTFVASFLNHRAIHSENGSLKKSKTSF